MACFERNNITHYAKWPPPRTTLPRSCQTAAAAAATNKSTFMPNIRFCRYRGKVGHRNTSIRGRCRRKRATKQSRRFSVTRPFPRFLSVARAVNAPALRDEWNTSGGSSATRHRGTFFVACVHLYNTSKCKLLHINEKRAPLKNDKYILAGRYKSCAAGTRLEHV